MVLLVNASLRILRLNIRLAFVINGKRRMKLKQRGDGKKEGMEKNAYFAPQRKKKK